MPAHELQSHIISITGLASHLERAKEGLLERVKELQAEQEDRVSLKSELHMKHCSNYFHSIITHYIFTK